MTASVRRRVYQRARDAWQSSHPHTAWEILAVAGMADDWPEFQRVALRHARNRYTRAMSRTLIH